MQTTRPTRIDGLIAAANNILARTPDHEWWGLRPLDVVAFAFPDWETVGWEENANYNRPTVSQPRILLRHRALPDQWLLIYATGVELLPGRMSTMGQFFRFKNQHIKNTFAVGTPDEIVAVITRGSHADTQRGILWWLLDTFTRAHPTPTPGWTFDADTQAPLWALLTAADTNLRRTPCPADTNHATTGDSTRDILSRAFPDWIVAGLHEHGPYRTRALLHSSTDADRWLYLSSWQPTLLAEAGGNAAPVLRAGEALGRAHTKALLGGAEDLLSEARHTHESWPTNTDPFWLLHHLSLAHPDPHAAATYAIEVSAELSLIALSGTPEEDKVYTELRDLLA